MEMTTEEYLNTFVYATASCGTEKEPSNLDTILNELWKSEKPEIRFYVACKRLADSLNPKEK